MDADILQAIRIIDDKIASLQEARNRLASAFGIGASPTAASKSPQQTKTVPAVAVTKTPGLNGVSNGKHPEPSGRKVELAAFLLDQGPLSRVAIVEKSGIPEGTVSYCLSDKRFFVQTEGGDWTITDFSKRGLERRSATGSFQWEQH